MASDDRCARCGVSPESVNHVLFQCPYARLVWSLAPWSGVFSGMVADSLYTNFASFLVDEQAHNASADDLCLIPWILWRLWKARNAFCFSTQDDSAEVTLSKAKMDSELWIRSQQEEEEGGSTLASANEADQCSFTLPETGWHVCHVDGAWSDHRRSSGLGWIVRDNSGIPLSYGMRAIPRTVSALFSEAEAALWAIECCLDMGMRKVVMLSDCKDLITAVKNPNMWPSIAPLISDFKRRSLELEEFKLEFKCRKYNQAADAIAGASHQLELYSSSLSSVFPVWLQPLCMADMHDCVLLN